uniref:HTH_Tnp_Tc3_2 domain-containing protein n=1 Tax=Heterorhabditis bacteriophora TaxID=37862 RepID=A0A1I7WUZ9_HETBA
MSKGKNITPNQRIQIVKKLELSRRAIQRAIKLISQFVILQNALRTRRNQDSTERIDRIIRRLSEDNQCSLSVSSIRRLVEVGLNGRVARKKPLASLKNRSVCVALEREHLTWSTADGKKYVRGHPGEEFMPKCTIPSIKHGDGSVMVWAAINRNGPGPLHIVEGIMDSTSYVRIVEDNLLPYVRSQSNATKRWLIGRKSQNGVAIPESTLESHRTSMGQCREGGTETKAMQYKALEAVIKKACAQISIQRCANLIDSMPRRCAAVIKNFGCPTKH